VWEGRKMQEAIFDSVIDRWLGLLVLGGLAALVFG
jgi:hypothetical protein